MKNRHVPARDSPKECGIETRPLGQKAERETRVDLDLCVLDRDNKERDDDPEK